MATKVIDVGSVKGNFYGGLPYDVSWNFNDGTSPSTLKVSVVRSDGIYPNPDSDLTYVNSVGVTIGKLTFNGYLVSYEKEETPQQKILHLNYIDKSADLERYYVGLYKRHGTASSGNLIIVGKEYHPCDSNRDSTVDYSEIAPVIDPCDPCPYMPNNKYQGTCDPIRTDFQIWEVFYTFNDLLDQIGKYFTINKPASVNKNFPAQHTGSVKSVLDAWCSDLGLAYYWDPFNNSLNFVDRTKPLTIPSNLSETTDLIEYRHGASKQNTYSRGFIGYFAKQGEIHSYTCKLDEQYSFQTLKPLKIVDLLNVNNYTYPTKELALGLKEISVVLSKYGKPIRDAYIWFHNFGIKTAKILNDYYKYSSRSPSNILLPFGQMKVLGVFAKGSTEAKDLAAYNLISKATKIDFSDPTQTTNPTYYFLADVSDQLATTQFESEQNLGRNFLGKFWYKRYNTPIPGAGNSNTQIEAESPDGTSVGWHISRKEVQSLPIFGFGHESGSVVDSLFGELTKDSKNNADPYNNSASGGTKSSPAVSAFLLMDRASKFIPEDEHIKDYEALFKWYEEYVPHPIQNVPDNILKALPGYDPKNKHLKVFAAREYSDFKIRITTTGHPLEPSTITQKKETLRDSLGNPITKNIGSYGLISNSCAQINIGSSSKTDIIIYTPAQSLSALTSDSSPGFTVFVQPSSEFKKVIPKVQYTFANPASSSDVAKVDYHYKEIQENALKDIQAGSCIPDSKAINSYVESLASSLAYTQSQPFKTASIKVPGIIPNTYSISQAINSIQVSVTENGCFTTYSFEDKVIQPPSDEYITRQYLLDKAKPLKSVANSFNAGDMGMVKTSLGS